ncbi:membrane protein insertion efficiency factor YidD [Glycomyces salinus]|uniref:membrane protein insertion efficiency factor YidD n=1 Tax=Glycomyces salinus TaxID=980294 RepID=UPI0018ECB21E|nr:membrane protein insertion efficiency factor YidD [Glycomyces salinus]
MKTLTPLDIPPEARARSGPWRSIPRLLGIAAIRLYQRTLAPLMPVTCRYVPSCSQYGLEAVRTYGLLTGARLALGRIRRCVPAQPHGTPDPLPVSSPRRNDSANDFDPSHVRRNDE